MKIILRYRSSARGHRHHTKTGALFTGSASRPHTNKTYQQQRALVAGVGPSYEVPHLLDAVTCVLLERVRTGAFLYADNSPWVGVQEQTRDMNLIFGAFSASGLCIDHLGNVGASDCDGIAVLRRL